MFLKELLFCLIAPTCACIAGGSCVCVTFVHVCVRPLTCEAVSSHSRCGGSLHPTAGHRGTSTLPRVPCGFGQCGHPRLSRASSAHLLWPRPLLSCRRLSDRQKEKAQESALSAILSPSRRQITSSVCVCAFVAVVCAGLCHGAGSSEGQSEIVCV